MFLCVSQHEASGLLFFRIGISNKNIAPFNYLQQERFLVGIGDRMFERHQCVMHLFGFCSQQQQGRCSQWSEMFSLAFEEANTLVREGRAVCVLLCVCCVCVLLCVVCMCVVSPPPSIKTRVH